MRSGAVGVHEAILRDDVARERVADHATRPERAGPCGQRVEDLALMVAGGSRGHGPRRQRRCQAANQVCSGKEDARTAFVPSVSAHFAVGISKTANESAKVSQVNLPRALARHLFGMRRLRLRAVNARAPLVAFSRIREELQRCAVPGAG